MKVTPEMREKEVRVEMNERGQERRTKVAREWELTDDENVPWFSRK